MRTKAVGGVSVLAALWLAACGSNDLRAITRADTAAGGPGDAVAPGVGVAEGGAPPAATDDGGGLTKPNVKRGLAYGYHDDDDLAALSAGIGWWYNWTAKPDDTLSKGYAGLGVEYVPMIWGKSFDEAELAKQIPPDARYLLTFNEPNFGAQADLTPEEAAALWPRIEAFAKSRSLKLVSPALNYCGGDCNETDPFRWLDRFFVACPSCQVDYVAMHWYACDRSSLTGVLARYEAYGRPLWVTEFSCLDEASKVNDADELAYMKDAVAALEADPQVFRYAWFTGRSAASRPISVLGAAPGELTPLGRQYLSLPR